MPFVLFCSCNVSPRKGRQWAISCHCEPCISCPGFTNFLSISDPNFCQMTPIAIITVVMYYCLISCKLLPEDFHHSVRLYTTVYCTSRHKCSIHDLAIKILFLNIEIMKINTNLYYMNCYYAGSLFSAVWRMQKKLRENDDGVQDPVPLLSLLWPHRTALALHRLWTTS